MIFGFLVSNNATLQQQYDKTACAYVDYVSGAGTEQQRRCIARARLILRSVDRRPALYDGAYGVYLADRIVL